MNCNHNYIKHNKNYKQQINNLQIINNKININKLKFNNCKMLMKNYNKKK